VINGTYDDDNWQIFFEDRLLAFCAQLHGDILKIGKDPMLRLKPFCRTSEGASRRRFRGSRLARDAADKGLAR